LKPVIITPAAERDIERIADWYERKREGLGVEFTDRAREAIDRIRVNPEGSALSFRDARRVQLRQFRDYSLWFQIRRDNSLVIACLSGRRDPRIVRERASGVVPIRPPDVS
jgi:toxin ParE1/3/4